ncbi:virulent strain associated lipoprotein (plasmid) [Borreliella finlandensis]|uniref:Virulent strain associated lipoprotein n=1 Tax=Borreliella finlandensis TaxID=498741 RepID=A0A806C5D5_9SPIR|nr:virulence associated lipoprotein [Borreliella finlandensis]ACN93531.1 virulent strain associated lipoprotein [Borreliella finlandensis]
MACNPNFNTNQKDTKYQFSKKEESPAQSIKTTLLNNLRKLIEQAHADNEKYEKKLQEEPEDQFGMLDSFKLLHWEGSNKNKIWASDDQYMSKRFRKRVYSALNAFDDNELKDFSKMIIASNQVILMLTGLEFFGITIEDAIHSLYSKKDNLEKLEIPNLKKVKNLFEQFLHIKQIASRIPYQLLLDYQNDENIKTDINKLRSHIQTIRDQMFKKIRKAYYRHIEISEIIYK